MRPFVAFGWLLVWMLILIPLTLTSYAQPPKYAAYLPLVHKGVPIVTISSQRGFYDHADYRVVGEVINTSIETGYDTRITARFYDIHNSLVAVGNGETLLTRIGTGEVMPFEVTLSNAPTTIHRYRLTVTTESQTWANYQPLTIISQQARDNYGIEVFGELQNDQLLTLTNIYVAVTFYDSTGTVVDVGYAYMGRRLTAGEIGTYRILTFEKNLIFDHFIVKAEGYTTE